MPADYNHEIKDLTGYFIFSVLLTDKLKLQANLCGF